MTYLQAIPLNCSDIAPDRLNIEVKERGNLLPWNGQFSPQFVEELIRRYAPSDCTILDPFCGSGTVLFEAAATGRGAIGIELNPAAVLLARIYTLCNASDDERAKCVNGVDSLASLALRRRANASDIDVLNAYLLQLRESVTGYERTIFEALLVLSGILGGADSQKTEKTWKRLRSIILELPASTHPIRLIHGDGRFTEVCSQVDLVITSPPYINVYNYHQQYRSSTEVLGWDLLKIARTEIGSNRKNRGNRFLTVVQYCQDLAICMRSLRNSLKDDGRMIFILGRESRVRGVPFANGELAAHLAIESCGLKLETRQERVFVNRYGQRIVEDILHLKKADDITDQSADSIAITHLRESLKQPMDEDVRRDIHAAIDKAHSIHPSPRFRIQEGQ